MACATSAGSGRDSDNRQIGSLNEPVLPVTQSNPMTECGAHSACWLLVTWGIIGDGSLQQGGSVRAMVLLRVPVYVATLTS